LQVPAFPQDDGSCSRTSYIVILPLKSLQL
jgi:hypothetical protein